MRWPFALRALRHPPLRRFFFGQSISLLGSWLQPVAQSWLAWRLTHSPQVLGLLAFCSQAPVFFLGVWAGSVVDRLPRKTVVMAALLLALVQAAALSALTFSGLVRPAHLFGLAALLGISYAFEVPARQALLGELAGEDLPNAVALNSALVTGMRVVGPSAGGILVATVGEGFCFAFNAVSYLAVLYALATLPSLAAPPKQAVAVTEGLDFARRQPTVRAVLVLLVASSFFGLPYSTLLPVVASQVLGGGAALLGRLLGAAGVGALCGALWLLTRRPAGLERPVGLGASLLGAGVLALSVFRVEALALGALAVAGFGQITQSSGTLTLVSMASPPRLRGRVLGVFSTLFIGVAPFGALVAGWVAARYGVPLTLAVSSSCVLLASAVYYLRPKPKP